MNLNDFFTFDTCFSDLPVCVINEELDWETSCRIIKGDYAGVKLPLLFKQSSGRKWTDLLNPNSVSMHIVSQRFIMLLENEKITGWKSYPIKIVDNNARSIDGYTGFSIIGKCGPIDYSKSEVYEKQLVPNGSKNKYYKGMHVGFDKWDGSDFFIPEGTLHIIITKKIKQVIKKYQITNVALKSLSEYEIAEYALPKNISLYQ